MIEFLTNKICYIVGFISTNALKRSYDLEVRSCKLRTTDFISTNALKRSYDLEVRSCKLRTTDKNRELKCFVYRGFEKYTLFMVSL